LRSEQPSLEHLILDLISLDYHQTHSIYSPMHEFMNQDHAVAAAESFIQTLMVQIEQPDTDPHDEELLGSILTRRGKPRDRYPCRCPPESRGT
jgi:hypothetical protein